MSLNEVEDRKLRHVVWMKLVIPRNSCCHREYSWVLYTFYSSLYSWDEYIVEVCICCWDDCIRRSVTGGCLEWYTTIIMIYIPIRSIVATILCMGNRRLLLWLFVLRSLILLLVLTTVLTTACSTCRFWFKHYSIRINCHTRRIVPQGNEIVHGMISSNVVHHFSNKDIVVEEIQYHCGFGFDDWIWKIWNSKRSRSFRDSVNANLLMGWHLSRARARPGNSYLGIDA